MKSRHGLIEEINTVKHRNTEPEVLSIDLKEFILIVKSKWLFQKRDAAKHRLNESGVLSIFHIIEK